MCIENQLVMKIGYKWGTNFAKRIFLGVKSLGFASLYGLNEMAHLFQH